MENNGAIAIAGGWHSVRLLIRYIGFRFTFYFLYIIFFFQVSFWFRLDHKQPNVIAYLLKMEMIGAKAYNSIEHSYLFSFLLYCVFSSSVVVVVVVVAATNIQFPIFILSKIQSKIEYSEKRFRTVYRINNATGKKWQIHRNGNERKREWFYAEPRESPEKKEIIVETHPKWQKLYVYTIAIPFELCLNHINI